jgi:hypothetical protein
VVARETTRQRAIEAAIAVNEQRRPNVKVRVLAAESQEFASCDDELRQIPRAETATCHDGRCVVDTCRDGYADCDGAPSTGCERPLTPQDCGRCGGCPDATVCNQMTRRCEEP